MDQNYKEARQAAGNCEEELKNSLDDKAHPIGRSLLDKSRQLVSEVDARRDPRQLENRIKEILSLLQETKNLGELVMDQRHTLSIKRGYEQLIMRLREFDNY